MKNGISATTKKNPILTPQEEIAKLREENEKLNQQIQHREKRENSLLLRLSFKEEEVHDLMVGEN